MSGTGLATSARLRRTKWSLAPDTVGGDGKNRRRETVRGFACHLRSDVESHSLRHVVYSVQIFTLHSGCMVSTIPWNHTPIVIE
jgi:hypothetical protein